MSASASASASVAGGATGIGGGDAARPVLEEQEGSGQGGGSSGFRSGLMMEGDSSAFGPLGQIEENAAGGGVEDMEIEHDAGAAFSQQHVRCNRMGGYCGVVVFCRVVIVWVKQLL